MAWVNFPVAISDPIQLGRFKELSIALNERVEAVGFTPGAAHGNSGDDIQKNSSGGFNSYQQMQDWIVTHCDDFINPDISYHQAGAPDSTLDWRWTIATLRSAVGLNPAGFTRKYWRIHSSAISSNYIDFSAFADGHRSLRLSDGQVYDRVAGTWVYVGGCWGGIKPDTVTNYGLILDGDFLDRVVYNEIYACFNKLIWTLPNSSWDNGGSTYTDQQHLTSWAAAKALADAEFDSGLAPGGAADAPQMETRGFFIGYTALPYVAQQHTIKSRLASSPTIPNFVSRTLEFYLHISRPDEAAPGDDLTYDDQGYGFVENDWNLIGSVGPNTTTAIQYSPYVGDDTVKPPWCDEPFSANGKARGFHASGGAIIAKWDFTKM